MSAHIGVVGGLDEAPNRPPAVTERSAGPDRQQQRGADEGELAAPGARANLAGRVDRKLDRQAHGLSGRLTELPLVQASLVLVRLGRLEARFNPRPADAA